MPTRAPADGFMTPHNPDSSATLARPGAAWPVTNDDGDLAVDTAAVGRVRGRFAAAAEQTEWVRALLVFADAAAVAFALGVGVQFFADAPLRFAAILVPVLAIPFARVFGLYARPGRGLGRSTLAEVPQLAQLATLLALLGSFAGPRIIATRWDVHVTLAFWVSLLIALPVARGLARRLPAAVAPERCLVIGSLARSARVRRTIHGLSGGRSAGGGWVTPEQGAPGGGGGGTPRPTAGYPHPPHAVLAPGGAASHTKPRLHPGPPG